jgi:protein phosphatase
MTAISIPDPSLVVLVGPSGSGKSTFARRHFKPTEVLSSDFFRGLVRDDETDQSASRDAFEVLHLAARKRLAAGKLTVIDATNVQEEVRQPLIGIAREHDCLATAIVLDIPARICHERNQSRQDRRFQPYVTRQQSSLLGRSLRSLRREGFRTVHVLSSPEQMDAAVIERRPLWTDRRGETGPFDVIGDVHGCHEELVELLGLLGWEVEEGGARHPAGRKAIFVGDLVDRGPATPRVLRLVMGMVESGSALCVPGNHDAKLLRKLRGKDVRITHGLAQSLEQLEREPPEFRQKAADFIDGLISHYVLDGGKLVVAHAGMKEAYQGRASGRVREFALYGETTGESDELGLPVRLKWAEDYRGRALVVYGHTPVASPEWLNNTVNIDTGCVFGGRLTALRYPEREVLSVPAHRVHCPPKRPIEPPRGTDVGLEPQQVHDDVLDIEDVIGRRIVSTRHGPRITVREENAAAALEAISRFSVDPKWLIYAPPTMSPPETTSVDGLLEHPAEAFDHYLGHGISRVVCEEKHMGSRAVVIACRDADAARKRFGVIGEASGSIYTRTGRPFFADRDLEAALLERVARAFDRAGLWDTLATDWVCLDCELLPWSAKASSLIREQYAAVGAAARASLGAALELAGRLAERGIPGDELASRLSGRLQDAGLYTESYRRYARPTAGTRGPSRGSETCASHPSTSLRARGRSTSIIPTRGTWRRSARPATRTRSSYSRRHTRSWT